MNLFEVGEIIDSETVKLEEESKRAKVFDKTEINKAYGFEHETCSAYVMFVYLKSQKKTSFTSSVKVFSTCVNYLLHL